MCCYAGKLLQQAEMNNPTIVVVTDRNDLDGQLYATFCQAQDLLKQTPLQANDRDELRELLNARESGGIIFTTVQKFAPLDSEQSHPALNQRSNIVVISDEAHRSQYGLSATLDRKLASINTATPNTCAMRCRMRRLWASPVRRLPLKIKIPVPCSVIMSLSTIFRMRLMMARRCRFTTNPGWQNST
jgi:hypothetical protein